MDKKPIPLPILQKEDSTPQVRPETHPPLMDEDDGAPHLSVYLTTEMLEHGKMNRTPEEQAKLAAQAQELIKSWREQGMKI